MVGRLVLEAIKNRTIEIIGQLNFGLEVAMLSH